MVSPEVEIQLLEEKVRHLDLTDFCIVTADTTVRETIERMRDTKEHCAFIVGEKTRLLGIVTDRDVLKKVVNQPDTWDQPIESIMTSNPKTLSGNASTSEALRLMDQEHFRNVPVVSEDRRIIGNVTHYSVLDYLVAHYPEAVYNLPPDPENYASRRDGG